MKPRYFIATISISAMVLTCSLYLCVSKANPGVVAAGQTKTSYGLDIADLSSKKQVLNTTYGNPIQFDVTSFEEGTFSAGGSIQNKTALSGLQSITVTGLQPEASFTVAYGWTENDWDVSDGIIDSVRPTYDFNGELPSFFKISSASPTAIGGISLSYSCNATYEPMNYVLSYEKVGETEYSVTACKSTARYVVIPSSYEGLPVTSIGPYAILNLPSLTFVDIPLSVTNIEYGAFGYCSSLPSIAIPDSVTHIGRGAFWSCCSLKSISIGSGLSSIDYEPFFDCGALSNISVEPGNPTYDSRDGCNAIIETASNTLVVGSINTIIPDSVTAIGNGAFIGHSGLKSIAIPVSVTSIGYSAFSGCSSLTSISYDGTVAQWNAIPKGNSYLSNTTVTQIVCSDGAASI